MQHRKYISGGIEMKRIGHCCFCGECCVKEVSTWYMTGYDPAVGPRTHGCRFLKDMGDGTFKCRIRMGEILWERLSENVKRYYKREYVPYPDPNDEAHWPVSNKCTYDDCFTRRCNSNNT